MTSGPFLNFLSLLTSLGLNGFFRSGTPKGLAQELLGTLSGSFTGELCACYIPS